MNKHWYFLAIVYCYFALPSIANAEEGEWEEHSFVGHTRYTIEQNGDRQTIKAEASGTASVLFRSHKVDLGKTPIVHWRWKINSTYGTQLDEQSRDGDDYPARIYFVVKVGPFPWQTLAVNYVWSSSGQVGDSWPNAYTKKAQMMAIQAGSSNAGRWVTEKRNVVEDFKRLFDVDVGTLDGYAVMVDGDNTGSTGTAWFSDIRFSDG